jgi:hypothetical protein
MRVFFIIGSLETVLESSGLNFLPRVITGALQYADDGPAREEPEDEMEW